MHFRFIQEYKLNFYPTLDLAKEGLFLDTTVRELISIEDFTFAPGSDNSLRISNEQLFEIRKSMLQLKREAELQSGDANLVANAKSARIFDQLLYTKILGILPLSYYEASKPEIWNYLTNRVLLDIAYWRFGDAKIHDRYIGLNRARHVFARWWFRARIASTSTQGAQYNLRESVWENIFERQSLCWNFGIANACLRVLQETRNHPRHEQNASPAKSADRIWIGRIMRMTSQSSLDGFSEDELFEQFLSRYPS